MNFLTVNYHSKESTLQSFDQIAKKFADDIQLQINDTYYRVVDFEFYSYSTTLPDPHTYKNDIQLTSGRLYLNASGVDITFGDGTNHGGILLRSVIKLFDGADKGSGFMKQQYTGPQVVATELFANLKPLTGDGINDIRLIDLDGHNQDHQFYPGKTTIKTKRVGLTPKIKDPDSEYLDLKLRYIVLVPVFKNFKQKVIGIETFIKDKVAAGELTSIDAKELLGYDLKHL